MRDPVFRRSCKPLPLAVVAAHGLAALPAGVDPAMVIAAVAALGTARPDELAVADGDGARDELCATRAGACFVAARHRDEVPPGTIALVSEAPMSAFLRVAALIDPGTRRPGRWPDGGARHPGAIVHAEARVELGATIGPGAVVGPGAEVGAGTAIGANCFIDADVRIGRCCALGPQVTVSHALLGDNVVVHAGARIGVIETGVRALGRAIVQNDVEIGANAVVARGAMGDTVIGEGAVLGITAFVAADTTIPRFATVQGSLRR